jgi:hypothetical protein
VVRGEDGAEYQEVSVAPAGVGHEPPLAGGERLPLDDDELSELAHGLYEVLRGCRGYRAALVGWNPEFFVDIAELNQDWAEDLQAGRLYGLVLAEETLPELCVPAAVEPFAPGFSWMPYQGQAKAGSAGR